jgi:hypothetical protein
MEVKGKLVCKKSDNKAFKLGDDWYNVNNDVVASLEKLSKGDEIVATYEKKGTSRYVSKLDKAGVVASSQEAEAPSTDGFKCAVCGAAMKTDKFKVCYMCNKKGLKAPGAGTKESSTYTGSKSNYGSKEDIAGKEIGCALNAAATVASGCGFSDPDTASQFVRQLANNLLEWIQDQKITKI